MKILKATTTTSTTSERHWKNKKAKEKNLNYSNNRNNNNININDDWYNNNHRNHNDDRYSHDHDGCSNNHHRSHDDDRYSHDHDGCSNCNKWDGFISYRIDSIFCVTFLATTTPASNFMWWILYLHQLTTLNFKQRQLKQVSWIDFLQNWFNIFCRILSNNNSHE